MAWSLDIVSLNAGLSFAAAVVSGCLALGSLIAARDKDGCWKAYLGLCLVNTAMAASDVPSWALAVPITGAARDILLLCNFTFNAAAGALFICYGAYLRALFSRLAAASGGVARYPLAGAARMVVGIYLTGCVVSIFNGMFFTAGGDTRYFRGDLFWFAQVFIVFLYIQAFATIVANRSLLRPCEAVTLASYVLLPAVCSGIQVLFFGAALVNPALATSLVLIFLGVQGEREAAVIRAERELARRQLELIEARIEPADLYARLDDARAALDTDPAQAARRVEEISRWLRGRMHAVHRD